MSTAIKVDATKTVGKKIISTARQVNNLRDQLNNTLETLDSLVNAGDFSQITTDAGVRDTAGVASDTASQSIYNLISGAKTDLEGSSNLTQLDKWLSVNF